MESQGRMSGRRRVVGEVRGSFRSAKLGWTDPQSGERLTLRLDAQDGLIETLEPLGFELLDRGQEQEPLADARQGDLGQGHWVLHAQLDRLPRSGLTDRPAAAG